MGHDVRINTNGSGSFIDTFPMSDGSVTVERQAVVIADDTVYANRAEVQNTDPASTDFGLTVREAVVGSAVYHVVSAATTNAANIKASAGRITGWTIFNNSGSLLAVHFHNTAGTPTAGSGVVYTVPVPPGSYAPPPSDPNGIAFSTGIGITITQNPDDADATAVAAGDAIVNIHSK